MRFARVCFTLTSSEYENDVVHEFTHFCTKQRFVKEEISNFEYIVKKVNYCGDPMEVKYSDVKNVISEWAWRQPYILSCMIVEEEI